MQDFDERYRGFGAAPPTPERQGKPPSWTFQQIILSLSGQDLDRAVTKTGNKLHDSLHKVSDLQSLKSSADTGWLLQLLMEVACAFYSASRHLAATKVNASFLIK